MSGRQAKQVRKKAGQMARDAIRVGLRPRPRWVPRFVWRALLRLVFLPGER